MPAPARPTIIKTNTSFRSWRDQFNASVELWNYFVNVSGEFVATDALLYNPQITQGTFTNVSVANSTISGYGFTNTRLTNPTISGGTQFGTTLSGVLIRNSTMDYGSLQQPNINEATISGGTIEGTYNAASTTFKGGTFSGVSIVDATIENSNVVSGVSIISPTVNGGDFIGTTISGGILLDSTIRNTTVSGGTLQSNTINSAIFNDLPIAPTTTPTLSGHLITKSYVDGIAPSVSLGFTPSDKNIQINRAVGITASGLVTTAGLIAPSLIDLITGYVSSPDLSSGNFKLVPMGNNDYAFIWSDITLGIIRFVVFKANNGVLSYVAGSSLSSSFGTVFDAGPITDVNAAGSPEGFTIFGVNTSTDQVKQRWYYNNSGSVSTLASEYTIPHTYSGLGLTGITMIQRNPAYPDVVGCIFNAGTDTFLYSSRINNGSTSVNPPQNITTDVGSGFDVDDHETLRFARYSEDSTYLHVYFPTDENDTIFQGAVGTNGQTASGVTSTFDFRISSAPSSPQTWGLVGIKDQWTVGNTIRMLAGSSSVNYQNLDLWEIYLTPTDGEPDGVLTIRGSSYAFVADTAIREATRINDELFAFLEYTVAPGGSNTATNVQFVHWPINGSPSIITTVEYAGGSASIVSTLASQEHIDNQVVVGIGDQTNDDANFALLELVYPIAVSNSVLASGTAVQYGDVKWDVANSSKTLTPGGPVYVPMTTSGLTGSGYIVSNNLMHTQDDGIRFGRALTDSIFLIQRQ